MNLFTKQKHRYWKQAYDHQSGNVGKGDKSGTLDETTHIHTTIYKIGNQQGPTV